MRVGVIASELEGQLTGVGRVVEGWLSGLESIDVGVELHLFLKGGRGRLASPLPDLVIVHESAVERRTVAWEQLDLPKQIDALGLDVVLGPNYAIPLRSTTPGVVAIFDLSFEVLPEEFGVRERWRRRLLARWSARRARRVVVSTEFMARELAARYRLEPADVAVVPLGFDAGRFRPATGGPEEDGRLAALGVRSPYLLWVGTVLERRYPQEVLEGFQRLRSERPELQLVVAGAVRMRSPDRFDAWIEALGIRDGVVSLGYVDEADLPALYRNAYLGVYVSRHEGYGLPPLECLACGTPVVVTGGQGLDDVWPDYPIRWDPARGETFDEAVGSVLDQPDVMAGVRSEAPERLRSLSWAESARVLTDVLRTVVAP